MTVHLLDERDDPRSIDDPLPIAEAAMAFEGLPADAELTVVLVDPAEMADLNARHMGKEGPTDVLAFPIEDMTPGRPVATEPDGPPVLIGDVFVCPDVVAANADEAGVAFEDEMALMVVHGVLHLCGYDHVVDADAEVMEGRERAVLASLGRVRP